MNATPAMIVNACLSDLSSVSAAIEYCEQIARSQSELAPTYAEAAAILRRNRPAKPDQDPE